MVSIVWRSRAYHYTVIIHDIIRLGMMGIGGIYLWTNETMDVEADEGLDAKMRQVEMESS